LASGDNKGDNIIHILDTLRWTQFLCPAGHSGLPLFILEKSLQNLAGGAASASNTLQDMPLPHSSDKTPRHQDGPIQPWTPPIVPPFAGVELVLRRECFELKPYAWVRNFTGMGRYRADRVGPKKGEQMYPFFKDVFGEKDIWVIVTWRRFEDGTDEAINLQYLDPATTEAEARKIFDQTSRFFEHSREELEAISSCFKTNEDDLAFLEGYPRNDASTGSIEEQDLYHARLKVLAGIMPKTIALIHQANETTDPATKAAIERKAVQAYAAELAHTWNDDQLKDWQRNNPLETEWLCHFAHVLREPEKTLDPVNQELALNWLQRGYNTLTAEELSDAILIATGQRMMPSALKKRRERLGLTTRRPTGPRPNEER
jgi:hypothetical protein